MLGNIASCLSWQAPIFNKNSTSCLLRRKYRYNDLKQHKCLEEKPSNLRCGRVLFLGPLLERGMLPKSCPIDIVIFYQIWSQVLCLQLWPKSKNKHSWKMTIGIVSLRSIKKRDTNLICNRSKAKKGKPLYPSGAYSNSKLIIMWQWQVGLGTWITCATCVRVKRVD